MSWGGENRVSAVGEPGARIPWARALFAPISFDDQHRETCEPEFAQRVEIAVQRSRCVAHVLARPDSSQHACGRLEAMADDALRAPFARSSTVT